MNPIAWSEVTRKQKCYKTNSLSKMTIIPILYHLNHRENFEKLCHGPWFSRIHELPCG